MRKKKPAEYQTGLANESKPRTLGLIARPPHPDMTHDSAILLVEDNEDDVALTKHAMKAAAVRNPVHVVGTGADAIDYLTGANEYRDRSNFPLPAVVFLDLKLPLMSGHEVLAWIRAQRHLETMVVVVLTSSDEPSDVRRSYSLGANSYLVKPLTARQLLDLARAFNWSWLKDAPAAAGL
jgi:CheY-like chemotaxis protein